MINPTFREKLPDCDGYYLVSFYENSDYTLVYLFDCRKYEWCDFDDSKPKDEDNEPPFCWADDEHGDPEAVCVQSWDPWDIRWIDNSEVLK